MSFRRSLPPALLLGLAACGPPNAPEDEIRALVAATEEAAEARDAGELKDFIADDYRDSAGRDASDARSFLHAWLVTHPSVNLVTRIDSIELEGTEQARVQVTVGLLGREAKGDSGWDLAADIDRLDIRLAREDGEWRVTGASRQDGR
jgi:hypothetical protein